MPDALAEKDSDGILTITLNRPDRLNAVSPEMFEIIRQALRDAATDPDVRAIILTGAGRGFCSGQDLKGTPEQSRLLDDRFVPTGMEGRDLTLFRHTPQPIVCAINGPAVGLGMAFACMCDIRVMSDRARFGARWLPRGIPPEGSAMFTLPQIVGIARALDIVLTGRWVEPQEALEIGLVSRVVPHEELMDQAREVARAIAEGPPVAVAMAKRAMYMGMGADMDTFAQIESWSLRRSFQTEDRHEGIRSFLEKRKPTFKGK